MTKPKSFLGSRSSSPSSATDQDFEEALGAISQGQTIQIFSQDISIERLRPNPFQARQTFSNLEELTNSIREQGFVSRLRVRPDPSENGYFQLVYGERRLRAAKLAGLTKLPCDVATYTDKQLIEIGLLENIQRQDLNPLEEAQALQRLIEQGNYTIRELAQRIGKNKDYIAGRLSLLQAPQEVQELVASLPQALSAARRIAQLPNQEERVSLIEGVLSGRLNTGDVRKAVQNTQKESLTSKSQTARSQSQATAGNTIVENFTSVRLDVQKEEEEKEGEPRDHKLKKFEGDGGSEEASEPFKDKARETNSNLKQSLIHLAPPLQVSKDLRTQADTVLIILEGWLESSSASNIQPSEVLEVVEQLEEKLLEIRRVAVTTPLG